MNEVIKYIKVYCLTFVIIIALMGISFCIPRKYISKNSIESIKLVRKSFIDSKLSYKYPEYLESDDGDLRYMEMIYLVDNRHPINSLVEMNSYLEGNLNELDKNSYSYTQYARYWHAPVLYLRIWMLFGNIKSFIVLEIIVLIIVSIITFISIYSENKSLAISFLIVYLMFSLFGIYKNISYFNCTIISMISTIIITKKYKDNKFIPYIFMINGLLVSLFDFLTIETLTLTFPLTMLIILKSCSQQELSIKEGIKYITIWIISYILPFIIKNIINYFYFDKEIIYDIFNRYLYEGNNLKFKIDLFKLLNNNLKLILPFYYLKNYWYVLIPIIVIFIYNAIFMIDFKKYRSYILVVIVCLIRFAMFPIQAILFSFTTFRTIIPICLFIIYIIVKQIENIINHIKSLTKQ